VAAPWLSARAATPAVAAMATRCADSGPSTLRRRRRRRPRRGRQCSGGRSVGKARGGNASPCRRVDGLLCTKNGSNSKKIINRFQFPRRIPSPPLPLFPSSCLPPVTPPPSFLPRTHSSLRALQKQLGDARRKSPPRSAAGVPSSSPSTSSMSTAALATASAIQRRSGHRRRTIPSQAGSIAAPCSRSAHWRQTSAAPARARSSCWVELSCG